MARNKGRGSRWSNTPNVPQRKRSRPRKQNIWHELTKDNNMFEKYYKALGIVPEEEWSKFVSALRRELPSTFRITGTRSHASMLLHNLKENYLSQLSEIASSSGEDDEKVEPPSSLPWYPDELAWKVNISRKVIRKSASIKKFHSFLVQETECGNISRQEAVSMIPPLLMDIKPGQKILDACAAPGSKTTQIIEMLHGDDDSAMPDGLVIANELQNKRCYMLIHQSKRLRSPSCVITNHDAASFPKLYIKGENDAKKVELKFDRILCDVPCSGDGTMRKNPLIWNKWTPLLGVGLHRIQMRILARAMEMLEVGGRIVYSTCTMAPVENEAVVAEVLRNSEGALELVDLSSELPNLKRAAGLSTWKLMMKDGTEVPSCDTKALSSGFKPSMWPPLEEEAKKFHLERCIRVYPHMQDSGGFFIAALVKTKHAPWENGNRFNSNPRWLPWQREADSNRGKRDEHNLRKREDKTAPPEATATEVVEVSQDNEQLAPDGDITDEIKETTPRDAASTVMSSQDSKETNTDDYIPLVSDEEMPSSSHNNEEMSPADYIPLVSEETPSSSQNNEEMSPADYIPLVSEETPVSSQDNDEMGPADDITEDVNQDDDVIAGAGIDDVTGDDVITVEDAELGDDSTNVDSVVNENTTKGNESASLDDKSSNKSSQPPRKKPRIDQGYKEDPFILLPEDDPDWTLIRDHYGFTSEFPSDQLLVRSAVSKKRNIYLVTKQVKQLIECMEDNIKLINTGVKTFSRCEAGDLGCGYRIMQEGLENVLPYVTKRKIFIRQEDVFTFLQHDKPFTNKFSESTRRQLSSVSGLGCVIFIYDPNGEHSSPSDTLGCKLCFCGWKARTSVRVLMSRSDKNHYLTLFGKEPLTAADNAEPGASLDAVVESKMDEEEPRIEKQESDT